MSYWNERFIPKIKNITLDKSDKAIILGVGISIIAWISSYVFAFLLLVQFFDFPVSGFISYIVSFIVFFITIFTTFDYLDYKEWFK
jgi:type IV secretory pathway TrbL component